MNRGILALVAAIFLAACQTTTLQVQKISAQDARLKYNGPQKILEQVKIPNARAYSEAILIEKNPYIHLQEAYPGLDFTFPLEQHFIRYSESGDSENSFRKNGIEIDQSDIQKIKNKFGEGLYIFKGKGDRFCISYMVRFGKSGWNQIDSSGTSQIYTRGCGTYASRDLAEKGLRRLLALIDSLEVTK